MSHDDALSGLTSSSAAAVQASDGQWYILPLLLTAYRAGRLKQDSPAERLARQHWVMRDPGVIEILKPN